MVWIDHRCGRSSTALSASNALPITALYLSHTLLPTQWSCQCVRPGYNHPPTTFFLTSQLPHRWVPPTTTLFSPDSNCKVSETHEVLSSLTNQVSSTFLHSIHPSEPAKSDPSLASAYRLSIGSASSRFLLVTHPIQWTY